MMTFRVLMACLLSGVLANELPTEAEKEVWGAIGTFGHGLTQKLNSLKLHDNVLISPYSIGTALSMALVGAKGTTKQEMVETLNFQGISDDSLKQSFSSMLTRKHENTTKPTDAYPDNFFTMQAANRLYLSNQYKIKDDYRNGIQKDFHSDAVNVDFKVDALQVKNEINAFVENRTNGLIKEILQEPLSPDSIMAIINTLYFKGQWLKKMAENSTQSVFNQGCGPLQSDHSKWLTVTSRFKYLDSANLKAQLVLLPYISGKFSTDMLIILPKEEHDCKTQAWFDQLSWANIKSEFKAMQYEHIALSMPAFEMNSRYNLDDVLPLIGMKTAFEPGRADFNGITEEHKLNIDKVIHQTKMIVTRFGTEASAVTVIAINRLAAFTPQMPIPLNINRSFYVSILYHHYQDDDALLPLFTGVVNRLS